MQHKKTAIALILCGSIFSLVSCYKNKTVLQDTAEITRTVTFSQDIIPIFNKSCNLSGCHSSGGQAPNLTEANAFNSLTIGNYIDKTSPENSTIYLKMTGKRGTPMPVSGSNKDYNALILAWIKQGANNN
ncbi:hypothetical protein [Flavisolibacter ginsenosidimutans]|uniref:Cytochrome C Planctomycete-type domain-containing protein n=1 Tax=Flavisolibacter ginsenosidimutans TaxID=661481 RepID=A0A5B8UH43_9BACT|nr:hypothetical protein [Flavisolibacter ginsenosidimutans]QEC55957.1 hypothetical protein FSB75_08630 [Flavisolibacter ginsenosidimutans]